MLFKGGFCFPNNKIRQFSEAGAVRGIGWKWLLGPCLSLEQNLTGFEKKILCQIQGFVPVDQRDPTVGTNCSDHYLRIKAKYRGGG